MPGSGEPVTEKLMLSRLFLDRFCLYIQRQTNIERSSLANFTGERKRSTVALDHNRVGDG